LSQSLLQQEVEEESSKNISIISKRYYVVANADLTEFSAILSSAPEEGRNYFLEQKKQRTEQQFIQRETFYF
jgi:hypothetical protein